jgi:hypothetical protein
MTNLLLIYFNHKHKVYLIIHLNTDGFIAYIHNKNIMDGETSDSDRVSSSGTSEGFSDALDSLKEAGCMVLVTGVVDETVRAAASRRLFGIPQLPRQRVVVHTDDIALQPASYLPHGIAPKSTNVQVCDLNTLTRSDEDAEKTDSCPSKLVVCAGRLARIIADSEPTSDEFAPGEIRVGILTLSRIVEQYGRTATETFLSSFGERVQNHHGLIHCHLPIESESTTATELASSVDVHIHLRDPKGSPPEQRWHLRETDCSSRWIPLQSTD